MSPAAQTATSSFCRRGEHKTCQGLSAKCGCSCHGPGGQTATARYPAREASTSQRPGDAVLIWEDPPPLKRASGMPALTDDIQAALKANRGRWARIKHYQSNTGANSAATRLRKTIPGFECAGRRDPTGGSTLYARAVPK